MNSEGKGAIETAVGQYDDRAVLFRKDNLGPYGSALNDHMLTSIKHTLVNKCRTELNTEYELVQQNTLTETKGILKLSRTLPRYPGSVPINLDSLTDRFSPDITFRFSFGALGPMLISHASQIKGEVVRRLLLSSLGQPASPSSSAPPDALVSETHDIPSLALEFLQSPVGAIVVAGVAYSTPIRRILHYGVIAYGAMYVFQYTTYTKSKQISTYKHQVVDHTTARLADTSPQIGYYLIQDFKSHAEAHVDGVLEQMNGREDALQTRITQNECDLSALTELSSRAAEICKRSKEHESKFKLFEEKYLGQNPKIGTPVRERRSPARPTPSL